MTNEWLCPICGITKMKYGKTCPDPSKCGNKPHLTGSHYVDKDGNRKKLVKGESVGIAEIANEEVKNDL